ncbi:hypothetical protein [Actinoplanes sp. NPDC049118]|uniref:hypothetical protein n=1 Tax=Actinoplanes sp. NPDC049118 TaxID=3155769 RepID=UPI0033CB046C
MIGDCVPANGPAFLAFLKKAIAPHAGREIHVVLDNLSTHTTPDVKAWRRRQIGRLPRPRYTAGDVEVPAAVL